MIRFSRIAGSLAIALLVALGSGPARPLFAQSGAGSPLILISLDGFRWDYLRKAPAPALQRLVDRGVRADGLIPSFPTKTFPNHYTIVTGLAPEHHGIVANDIRDVATGRTFAMSKASEVRDPMWWGGEPLWVTAERAGRRAGTMFWPGSEAAIGGVRPSQWRPYLESMSGRHVSIRCWPGSIFRRRGGRRCSLSISRMPTAPGTPMARTPTPCVAPSATSTATLRGW